MGKHHVGLILDGDRVVAIEPAPKVEAPPPTAVAVKRADFTGAPYVLPGYEQVFLPKP